MRWLFTSSSCSRSLFTSALPAAVLSFRFRRKSGRVAVRSGNGRRALCGVARAARAARRPPSRPPRIQDAARVRHGWRSFRAAVAFYLAVAAGAVLNACPARVSRSCPFSSRRRRSPAPSQRLTSVHAISVGVTSVSPSANFIGPLLSGFLIDHIGYARTFAAIAMPLIPAIAFPRYGIALDSRRSHADGKVRAGSGGFLDLLRIRESAGHPDRERHRVRGMGRLPVLHAASMDARTGLIATAIGTVMSAFAISIILLRPMLPWAVKRTGEIRMLTYAMFVACAAFALFPLFQTSVDPRRGFVPAGDRLRLRAAAVDALVYNASPKGRVGRGDRHAHHREPGRALLDTPRSSAPSAPWQASRPCS